MVLVSGRPRTVRVRTLPREQRRVVQWLLTREGQRWARRHFDDATECHELIEIIDDYGCAEIADHAEISSEKRFAFLCAITREWSDLTWTPDRPPEYDGLTETAGICPRPARPAAENKTAG